MPSHKFGPGTIKGKTKNLPRDKTLPSGRSKIGTLWHSLFTIDSKRHKNRLPDERRECNSDVGI